MNTQDAIRAHIKKYCADNSIAMSELGRRMGKDHRYISSAINKAELNIGHSRVLFMHDFVNFPAELLAASEREQKHRKHIRYALQGQKQAGMRPGGKDLAESRQPWPQTVAKLKAQPPVYARAW